MSIDLSTIIFQQDNATPHVANIIKQWLKEQKINLLDWTPQSPDLNII